MQSGRTELNTMPDVYPAATMLSSFSWNVQTPRSTSAVPVPAGGGSAVQARPTNVGVPLIEVSASIGGVPLAEVAVYPVPA